MEDTVIMKHGEVCEGIYDVLLGNVLIKNHKKMTCSRFRGRIVSCYLMG